MASNWDQIDKKAEQEIEQFEEINDKITIGKKSISYTK